ncbi:protein FAM221B isoform X4 [Pteropus medius]|uniref:Protein FAM221B isoform X2 n=1 Tax=Pteropus vampyrus TaxID=132908 RepID=A0A6P3RUF1_PTEVA|nr:protein FAM221B isoform X2 [Pteropus vampyrus]XP_039731344.1 protein FAM221B isoform X4 [Pteropus giganteus]
MEADKVIEEPQTTMDAEEHPSSKDPSAEDSQEPLITETPLEPSISETPLEPLTPETLLEPSTSQTPLETHTSETSLKPSIPQTSLEPHAYETLLEPSTSKASTPESPLESHISKVPEKHLSFHNSSPGHSSMSSSDTLKEDFFSESSSRKPSWRRSAQTSESEILEQHSLSGPSAQVHLDTSAKEREEDEEKEEVDTSIGTTHTAQPGRHPGKKKKGISRLYIGWRCPHYLWDCFRIGDESKCFCGHLLREHQIISDISVPCNVGQCRCLMFCFIPSRPEEVGEFWLKRRATFDPKAWRAQCRCKHSHEDHAATRSHPCRVKGCCCNCFESNFLCAACDRRWEEHETFFETEETRRRGGRPHGADYVPFAEMPTLRETIISNSDFKALQKQGPSGQRSSHPSPPGLPGSSSLKPGPTFDPRT